MTPGPFKSYGAQSFQWNGKFVGLFTAATLDAERDEMIDLLNKGTHFEGLIGVCHAALNYLDSEGAGWEAQEAMLAELKAKAQAAIAKADGTKGDANEH